jgi:tetratricopeptide (TPR) repeat protein
MGYSWRVSMIVVVCVNLYAQNAEIADDYFTKAEALYNEGKYVEAVQMYEKSVEAERTSPAPRPEKLGSELSWMGTCYDILGQYEKSLECHKQALDIFRKQGQEEYIASVFNNIGLAYHRLGQYGKAIEYYQQSLKISGKLRKDISNVLNNIGKIYHAWGKYNEAIWYFQQALKINRKLAKEEGIILGLLNIGEIYQSCNQSDTAMEYFQQALEIIRKQGKENSRLATTIINNIGMIYYNWGQNDKAIDYFQKAMDIDRKQGQEGGVAAALNNIGHIYLDRHQYVLALRNFHQALKINRKLNDVPDIELCLGEIGHLYYTGGNYPDAIRFFSQSIELIEKIRKTATGDVRRDYLETQIGAYRHLISAFTRIRDFRNAYSTVELSRAKLLVERISGIDFNTISNTEILNSIPGNSAILAIANANQPYKSIFVLTQNNISGQEVIETPFIYSILRKYKATITAILQSEVGIPQINNKETSENIRSTNNLLGIEEKSNFDKIITLYRGLLTAPASQVRGMRITGVPSSTEEQIKELSRCLYDLLIKPLEKELEGKSQIIIMPDGILGFIPFETLIDSSGKYLGEKYNITYTQSMTVQTLINKRNYSTDRKPLIAFGGAIYNTLEYKADTIVNRDVILYLVRQTEQAIATRSSTRSAYVSLGKAEWANLPMTLAEVNDIGGIVRAAKTVTGESVSENNIKALSESGMSGDT